MSSGKKGIVLVILVLCPGLAIAGLAEFRVDPISMDQVGNMIIQDYIPNAGYTFSFVNGARDITDGSDFEAVRGAFGTWIDEPDSAVWATEKSGGAAFQPGQMNHQNEISWISPTAGNEDPWSRVLHLPDEMIAAVITWIHPTTRRVLEQDLYFNDVDMHWRTESDGEESGGFFVEHIALHEIGHLFGLRDVYNPGHADWEEWMGRGNRELTMYGYSSWRNEDVTLDETTIAAIALLHPSSSIPEPRSITLFAAAGCILLVTRRR